MRNFAFQNPVKLSFGKGQIAALGREEVDFVLAVDGGSVLDGAKFVALATPF